MGTTLLLSDSKTSYVSYTKMFVPHNMEPSASPKSIVINVMAMELLARKSVTVLMFLTQQKRL